MMKGWGRKR